MNKVLKNILIGLGALTGLFIIWLFIPSGTNEASIIETFNSDSGGWVISDDITISDGFYRIKNTDTLFSGPDFKTRDGEIRAVFTDIQGEEPFGIYFRKDENDFAYFLMTKDGVIIVGNGDNMLLTEKLTLESAEQYEVSIRLTGHLWTGYINDEEAFSLVIPDRYRKGSAGLFIMPGMDLKCDEFEIINYQLMASDVSGTVREKGGSQPDIPVRAYLITDPELWTGVLVAEASTDHHGKYVLHLPEEGMYSIEAGVTEPESKQGKGAFGGRIFDSSVDGQVKDLDITLQ